MNRIKSAVALLTLGAIATAQAQAAAPDPSTITTTATTAFEGVATLCVAMLSFFVVFRIIKAIRK